VAEDHTGDWRAQLAERLARQPGPRVRVGEERVEFGESSADVGDRPVEQPCEIGSNTDAVTLIGLDDPRSLAAALTALASSRPVTLLDAGWPQAWLDRCRAESPAAATGLRVGELDPDGLPGVVEVTPAAVRHAIRHATEALRLAPGASLVVGGLPPSVALLLGVLPSVLADASVTLAPGGSRELLDLVAWDGADAALVDRSRTADLLREGWDAGTHVVSYGDQAARHGLLGPAALGHAAAAVLDGRASLLDPVRIVTAGDESLAGAVGDCALGAVVSGWRARQRGDATLMPIAPVKRPSLTVAELVAAARSLPDGADVTVAAAADPAAADPTNPAAAVLLSYPSGPPPLVPDWLAGCRIDPGRRPWRLVRAHQQANDDDPVTAVVRLVGESCLGVPVPDLDRTFFELGGHSLLVTQLAAELTDLLGVPLGLGEVFRYPSVRALSGWLAAALDDSEVLRRLGRAVRA